MIQRIQTIWLIIAAACIFLTLKFSTYTGTAPDLTPATFINGTYSIALMSCTLAAGILTLVAIFLYKNRKLQLWMTILAIVLELLLLFVYYREIETFQGGAISISALLHGAVIVFLILAARGINADEKLIKESSRLR